MPATAGSSPFIQTLLAQMIAAGVLATFLAAEVPPRNGVPEWEAKIYHQLERCVSFDFVETPLEDAMAFLSCCSDFYIEVDRACIEGNRRPITLKLDKAQLRFAMNWLVRLAGVAYDIRDERVVVSTPERLGVNWVVRVYDCRDLLSTDGQNEMLGFIRDLTNADWTSKSARVRFLDGRLVVGHQARYTKEIDDFMGEFRSGIQPGPSKDPEETTDLLQDSLEELGPQMDGPCFQMGGPCTPVSLRLMETVREQGKKRVSFDFSETPLADMVAFLTNVWGTCVIIDPVVLEGDDVPITLRVKDMRMDHATAWVARMAGLQHEIRMGMCFFSTPERLGNAIGFRVYDCRNLLAEDSHAALLELIQGLTGPCYAPQTAVSRFLDGRLIVRNEGKNLGCIDDFMARFVAASRRP